MAEATLNAMAEQLVDLTLCKTRYDAWDLQWYTEGPFWRRTSMRYSRNYKIIPDYEIGDAKHGKTIHDILDESENLLANFRAYRTKAEPSETQRLEYLIESVRNLAFRSKMIVGEKFTFDEMTEGLYGIVAPEYDYKKFDEILDEMNQALPGKGDVLDKIADFRNRIRISPDDLLKVLKATTLEFHNIAGRNMEVTGNSMPRIRVKELANSSMVFLSILFGYDYDHIQYERNFNLLYPWTVDKIMEYVGHEMEPGHLTCFEKRLQTMIDTCWPEMSIISQFSSFNTFGEGSARHAISMSFDNSMKKQCEFEREYIFKNAGLDEGLVELMPLWHKFCDIEGMGKLEVTRHDWNKTWTKEESGAFLEKYGFAAKGEGIGTVDKLSADDDGHFVAHDYAKMLVKNYFNNYSSDTKKQWELYERANCGHITMKDVLNENYNI